MGERQWMSEWSALLLTIQKAWRSTFVLIMGRTIPYNPTRDHTHGQHQGDLTTGGQHDDNYVHD